MAGTLQRLWTHLFTGDAQGRFPADAMERIASEEESALLEVELRSGGQVVATVTCATGAVAPGGSEEVSCLGTDPMPADVDEAVVTKTF